VHLKPKKWSERAPAHKSEKSSLAHHFLALITISAIDHHCSMAVFITHRCLFMILVKSLATDFSTTHVLKWLTYLGVPFERVNDDQISRMHIQKEGRLLLELEDGRLIDTRKFTAYWYRRGKWSFKNMAYNKKHALGKTYARQNQADRDKLIHYLNLELKRLGDFSDQLSSFGANKIEQLRAAELAGMEVPDYLITTSRVDAQSFLKQHGAIITKVIHMPLFFINEGIMAPTYTISLGSSDLEQLPEYFSESLFQVMIPKRYEIRTFYLDGRTYSMAIFSQNDDQTKVDFRRYNQEKPNRNVPYQLPQAVKAQLDRIMQHLQLRSGSFDIIRTPDGRFVFLEVNPVGQFGMTSIPCNFYLEEKIAKYLIDED
jgi:ATP-GRASP peptide maturase of grasp-with-spasm system